MTPHATPSSVQQPGRRNISAGMPVMPQTPRNADKNGVKPDASKFEPDFDDETGTLEFFYN